MLNKQFHYSKKDNALRFVNGNTTYTITTNGIIATTPNKKYDMKALPASQKGSLTDILKNKFENVLIE